MAQILSEGFMPSEILSEDVNGVKKWYIHGVFAQAGVLNKNHRIYPEDVLDEAIETYKTKFLHNNQAVGEANHPDCVTVDLSKISHRIISIEKEGKDYRGKALVLNTPKGKEIQALLEGGVRIGVSTRGYGSTKKNSSGITEVCKGYTIVAIDAVFHPSAPDALVNALMEGQEWVWDRKDEDIIFLESIKDTITATNVKRLDEQKVEAFKKFLSLLK